MHKPITTDVTMLRDWTVLGEVWKKGKTYPAEERERRILVEELQVAEPAADKAASTQPRRKSK